MLVTSKLRCMEAKLVELTHYLYDTKFSNLLRSLAN